MSTMGLYTAIDFLPLSQAVTIYYTMPMFVAVNCFLFLGERLARIEILSIFSAMFGVILLTQPQLIVPSLWTEELSTLHQERSGYDYYFGVFLSLFGSLAGSGVYVCCRKLGTQIHVSVHPFFMALISGFGGVWILGFSRYQIGKLCLFDAVMLTICGLCSWIQ